jgi:hypothetical protein
MCLVHESVPNNTQTCNTRAFKTHTDETCNTTHTCTSKEKARTQCSRFTKQNHVLEHTNTQTHTMSAPHTYTHAHRHTLPLKQPRPLTSFFPFLHREQMKRAAREEGRGREEGEEGTATAASDLRPVSNTRDAAQWSPSTQGVLTQPSSRPCAHCLS